MMVVISKDMTFQKEKKPAHESEAMKKTFGRNHAISALRFLPSVALVCPKGFGLRSITLELKMVKKSEDMCIVTVLHKMISHMVYNIVKVKRPYEFA